MENNYFRTGEVKLNLNDGEPIISEHEFLFEPGMTVKKDFFIRNESTWDVYYRIYFDNISGGLADVLDVTIKNGETVLYSGKPSELVRSSVPAAVIKTVLKIYRLKGIHESDIRENKSLKFFKVGFITKNLGGKSHSSFAGLSDVEIV